MTDTAPHVQQVYSDFFMSKSVAERFRIGFDMSNQGRRMIECSVARQYPDLSEAEQKAVAIERMYRNDFSAAELDRIKAACIAFHQRQQDQSL